LCCPCASGLEAKGFVDKGYTTMILFYFVGSAIVGMICVQIGVSLARLGHSRE
jgi:CrcB protein